MTSLPPRPTATLLPRGQVNASRARGGGEASRWRAAAVCLALGTLTLPYPTAAAPGPAGGTPAEGTPAPASTETGADAVASAPAPAQRLPSAEPLPPSEDALPLWLDDTPLIKIPLPGGLVALIAQDTSLPVAAVTLAFPTGTLDDPEGQPGLTRALALHLEQGNRELRPGGRLAVIHGAGGHAQLAVGARQVRLEALVPAGLLDDVLTGLIQFSWSPTVTPFRWQQSVQRAADDRSGRPSMGGAAVAEAWDEPRLARAGDVAVDALVELPEEAVTAALRRRFDLRGATLVVVSPAPPQQTAATLRAVTSALQKVPGADLSKPATPGPAAAQAITGKTPGVRVAWGVLGTYAALWQARVVCGALNRQPRLAGEPPRAAVRCLLHEDPRRPTLQVTVRGAAPAAAASLLRERLRRLSEDPVDRDVLTIERRRQSRRTSRTLTSPLPLSSALAQSASTVEISPGDTITAGRALGAPDLAREEATLEFIRALERRWGDADSAGLPAGLNGTPTTPPTSPPTSDPSEAADNDGTPTVEVPVLEQGATP